jgi:isopentenyl-diphosphate delta-isomerase
MKEKVILVDKNDNELGIMEKQEAHVKGLLHRAFSVFIFNDKNELLLQRRAVNKYHSGGLWTNTCCSHPRQNEKTEDAAKRRLLEEMGMRSTLKKQFDFVYKAKLDNNLYEHEFDHVFFGFTNDLPIINPEEVEEYTYKTLEDIGNEMKAIPDKYTEWFKICFREVVNSHRNTI